MKRILVFAFLCAFLFNNPSFAKQNSRCPWLKRVAGSLLAATLVAGNIPGTKAEAPQPPSEINPETPKAVSKGLAYLKTQMNPGGFWDDQAIFGGSYRGAKTAMAGLAFLAAGYTPDRGEYKNEVRAIIEYFLSVQTEAGTYDTGEEYGRPMYSHGYGLQFLAQSYGMISDKDLRERVRESIKKAIKLIAKAQTKDGGWGYLSTPVVDEGSLTIIELDALYSCKEAGFEVDKELVDKAVNYLRKCESNGGVKYSLNSSSGSSIALSAGAYSVFFHSGNSADPFAERLKKRITIDREKEREPYLQGGYGFYNMMNVMQAFHQIGGETWRKNYSDIQDYLLAKQDKKDGSWDTELKPVFSTAAAIYVLTMPYEYLPNFTR